MEKTSTVWRCRVCGGEANSKDAALSKYEVRSCRSCGVLFLYPQPDHSQLASLHSSEEYFEHPYFEKRRGMDAAVRHAHNELLERLHTFGPFSRVLEIGCGTGELMHFIHGEFGCEVHGVDVSPLAIKNVPPGDKLFPLCADVRRTPYEPASFDLVLMVDVIEHVDEPMLVMKRVYEILAPGGIAYIHTLNGSSMLYRTALAAAAALPPLRPLAERLYIDFHPFYFNRGALDKLVTGAGFTIERRFAQELDMRTISYSAAVKAGLLFFYALQKFSNDKTTQTLIVRKP